MVQEKEKVLKEQGTEQKPVTPPAENKEAEKKDTIVLTAVKRVDEPKAEGKDAPKAEPTEKAEAKAEPKVEPKAEPAAQEEKNGKPVCTQRVATATYTDAQALAFLRKKIYQYSEIDENFLKKIAVDSAFKTELKYISVVQCSTEATYAWTTKKGGETYDHTDKKKLAKDFCDDVEELKPFDFAGARWVELDKVKEDGALLAGKTYSLNKAKKDFNAVVKQASPDKSAKIEKKNERYETLYLPVLKASCDFEGETYLGYVNLVNGECICEYKVSQRLQTAVEDAMRKAKGAKIAQVQSILFLALLFVMSMGKAIYHGMKAFNFPVFWVGCAMAGCIVLPALGVVYTKKFKVEKMKEKGVHTGKLPVAKGAKLWVALSWLISFVAVVVFFFGVVVK